MAYHEDYHVIAYLCPANYEAECVLGTALRTICMPENKSRYIAPLLEDRTRPPTLEPKDGSYDDNGGDDDGGDKPAKGSGRTAYHEYSPSLRLQFDDGRKNRAGVVFGTSPNADIVLPKRDSLIGLAPYQCVLTFDDHHRLILRDVQDPLGKEHGTSATYNGRGREKQRGFTWVLSGSWFEGKHQPIVIALHDNLRFEIIVGRRATQLGFHWEFVDQFRLATVTGVKDSSLEPGFQGLNLGAEPSGARGSHTREGPILLDKGIGIRTGRAAVMRVRNISTSLEYLYACSEALRKKHWRQLRREINMLKGTGHVHNVKLTFDYAHQHKKKPIPAEENLAIPHQVLSALRYLHESENPIIHGDIKASNILGQSQDPHPLHVKLSRFGYKKPKEFTYDMYYIPPEIFAERDVDTSVNIWALGVVAMQLFHGLPRIARRYSHDRGVFTDNFIYAPKLGISASTCPLLHFLSRGMIIEGPDSRHPAHKCSAEVEKLVSRSDMRLPTLACGFGLLTTAIGVILQNGQIRKTNYPDTTVDLAVGSYETYRNDAEEIHYMGRWDSKKVSWWAAPGIRFGFTGDTVAVTFGNLTISSTLVAYRLSGLDWAFTNVTAGATHLFISPETEGINLTRTISPHTFEMRVTNWGYGVQIDKVHVAEGHKLVKLPARPRSIEFIGDSLASGMHNSYEALSGFAYGVSEGFGNTEYSITAFPGICVSDQECWGNPRGQSHQWFYTMDTSWRATEIWGGELEYPNHLSEFGGHSNLFPRCRDEPEPWDFSKQQAADLVVINLGTNDANAANNVSPSTYVEHYKRLIQGVHGVWPDAQVIIMKMWHGFYQNGNTYSQNTDYTSEAYQVYEYFNTEAYLSDPVIWDGITKKESNTGKKTEPFVHFFNTDGILQHNDISPMWHPTDVAQIKVASHLMQWIKLRFGWEMEARGPEVWADTLYWNDEAGY